MKMQQTLLTLGKGTKKAFSAFRNPWLWVAVFITLFLAINWVLFHSYQQTEPDVNGWVQFWNYCGTDAFKAITVSVMIPLILAALGGIFKIRGAVSERIRQTQDKRTEKRWECVQDTVKLWNRIYTLTSEVRFFEVEAKTGKAQAKKAAGQEDKAEEPKDIKAIIRELENLCSTGEDIVNDWLFRFNNLKADARVLLDPMNVLLCSATTVAYCIRDGGPQDKDEIKELQDSLGVIQDVVRGLAHHSILLILKHSVDLRRHDLSRAEKKEAEDNITFHLRILQDKADQLNDFKWKNNELLSDITKKDKVEEFVAFQEAAEAMKEWLQKNPKPERGPCEKIEKYHERRRAYREAFIKSTEYEELGKAFDSIEPKQIARTWEIEYSKEYLKKLAQWLGFEAKFNEIKGAASPRRS
jgi:hypothetical protein